MFTMDFPRLETQAELNIMLDPLIDNPENSIHSLWEERDHLIRIRDYILSILRMLYIE
jgi:hypothetical protein